MSKYKPVIMANVVLAFGLFMSAFLLSGGFEQLKVAGAAELPSAMTIFMVLIGIVSTMMTTDKIESLSIKRLFYIMTIAEFSAFTLYITVNGTSHIVSYLIFAGLFMQGTWLKDLAFSFHFISRKSIKSA